ncbi:hypothetical protein SCOR_11820 [Sulfidibacter corallicola]
MTEARISIAMACTQCMFFPGFRPFWVPDSFSRRMTHGRSPETRYGVSFSKSSRASASLVRSSFEVGFVKSGLVMWMGIPSKNVGPTSWAGRAPTATNPPGENVGTPKRLALVRFVSETQWSECRRSARAANLCQIPEITEYRDRGRTRRAIALLPILRWGSPLGARCGSRFTGLTGGRALRLDRDASNSAPRSGVHIGEGCSILKRERPAISSQDRRPRTRKT